MLVLTHELAQPIEMDDELFLARATVLGFDLRVPRYAIVFDINDFHNNMTSRFSRNGSPPDELAIQQFKEQTLKSAVRALGPGGKEIITYGGEGKIVIFKEFSGTDFRRRKKEAETVINKVNQVMTRDLGITNSVGVGRLYQNYRGYAHSFREAVEAISIGVSLRSGGNVFWSEEMPLENLLTAVPKDVLDNYIKEVIGILLTDQVSSQREGIFQTLEYLLQNNLSITQTAQAMFLHRNTILFRLEKIEKLTGYKPAASLEQAIKLKLAIMAWRYLNNPAKQIWRCYYLMIAHAY